MEVEYRANDLSDEGFTLIEVVTTVSTVLIVSVSGFFSVNGLSDHAKDTSVKKTANDAVSAVLVSKTSPYMPSPVPTLEEIEQGYNKGSQEIQLEITEDAEKNVIIVARGWDKHAVKKVIDSEYRVHDKTEELREQEREEREERENGGDPHDDGEHAGDENDPSKPEFLDNPSENPEGVNYAPTKKDAAQVYAEEIMRRGVLYETIYTPQLHRTSVGDQWMEAIGATYDGLWFLDTYWGHFTVVSDPHVGQDFIMPFVMVITGHGDAYYIVRDGYELSEDEREYLSFFDATPFL